MAGDEAGIRNHRDLIAWQKAVRLVTMIYQLSGSFPKEELYGLTSQMRRAAVSIPANIAEGQGRRKSGEFLQFLSIARGSLYELDTHLEIAMELRYLANESPDFRQVREQMREVARLLNGLIKSLES